MKQKFNFQAAAAATGAAQILGLLYDAAPATA
jgi:hypothetical protein